MEKIDAHRAARRKNVGDVDLAMEAGGAKQRANKCRTTTSLQQNHKHQKTEMQHRPTKSELDPRRTMSVQ